MKTTNTFGVQIIVRPNKRNKQTALIYARITINDKRLEISLKLSINPANWIPSKECCKGYFRRCQEAE